jgi:hypothetical protein
VRPALLVRFPRLKAPGTSWPVIPEGVRAGYPALQEDFAVLDEEVAPAFTTYDLAALNEQNRHRRHQVVLILGSAIVSGLGGLQAVFPDERWPGILLAALGLSLSVFGVWSKGQRSLDGYLTARLRAERLRALHFRFLSASGRYAGAQRREALRAAVRSICDGREPE